LSIAPYGANVVAVIFGVSESQYKYSKNVLSKSTSTKYAISAFRGKQLKKFKYLLKNINTEIVGNS